MSNKCIRKCCSRQI